MSRWNHGPPLSTKTDPYGGMPPFARNSDPMHHPSSLEEMREAQFARGHSHRPLPPHPAIIKEQLETQHQDIQELLVDNQRLAATHVALKQEFEAVNYELQQTDHFAKKFFMEKDMQMRELYDNSAKMESDINRVEGMRAELMQLHDVTKELTATRQKLAGQVQALTQDLARADADLQKVPALKSEIGEIRQELQRARAAIEYEKRGHAENYEHGHVMEKNLVTMGRELEKLRAEMANAEKRTSAAAPGYNTNYGNAEANYGGNPYASAYGMGSTNQMNPVQAGAEGYPQYAAGVGSWGSYDTQQAQQHR